MAQYISRLASVQAGADLRHFIYYIPSGRFEHQQTDDWIIDRFAEIGDKLGPKATVIRPTYSNEGQLCEEIATWAANHRTFYYITHSRPLLLISEMPIGLKPSNGEESVGKFFVLPLGKLDSNARLGRCFDTLASAASQGEDLFDAASAFMEEVEPKWADGLLDSLELKPNALGLGVNLNGFIDFIRAKFSGRRNRPLTAKQISVMSMPLPEPLPPLPLLQPRAESEPKGDPRNPH